MPHLLPWWRGNAEMRAWELQLLARHAGQAIRGWTRTHAENTSTSMAQRRWARTRTVVADRRARAKHAYVFALALASCEHLRARRRHARGPDRTGRTTDGRAKATRRPKPIINDDRKETTRATASQQLYKFFFFTKIYYRIWYLLQDIQKRVFDEWYRKYCN
jgi:hypothetical protein